MYRWDDLRFFLAVARAGSTMAAAKRLGVSQATVSRRIAELERQLGNDLFSRSPSGYELTDRGRKLLKPAEEMERAADLFRAAADAEERRLSGRVRLTTVESAADSAVVPALAALAEKHPDIVVEIDVADSYRDIGRGEADIAIRFGARPDQNSLIVRHLADLRVAFYVAQRLFDQHGVVDAPADIARYPMILQRVGWERTNLWIESNVPTANFVQSVDSIATARASVRAGLGATALPCIMGDEDADLIRLFGPIEELSSPCWLVTSDQARRQPHVRAVIDIVIPIVIEVMSKAGR